MCHETAKETFPRRRRKDSDTSALLSSGEREGVHAARREPRPNFAGELAERQIAVRNLDSARFRIRTSNSQPRPILLARLGRVGPTEEKRNSRFPIKLAHARRTACKSLATVVRYCDARASRELSYHFICRFFPSFFSLFFPIRPV